MITKKSRKGFFGNHLVLFYTAFMNHIKKFFKIKLRYFNDRSYVISLVLAVLFFVGSLVTNYFASTYASNHVTTPVGDIFLSNIPPCSVGGLFVYGSLVFWIFSMVVYLTHLQKLPFTLKTSALFVLIRALFINLTWIGPFPDALTIPSSGIFSFVSFRGDLFFSGHTGFPLLMAFIFWDSKFLRYCFISWSVFFAAVVLLGHLHYSIDVVSALFITYTIFHLSQIILKKDFQMAKHGMPVIE